MDPFRTFRSNVFAFQNFDGNPRVCAKCLDKINSGHYVSYVKDCSIECVHYPECFEFWNNTYIDRNDVLVSPTADSKLIDNWLAEWNFSYPLPKSPEKLHNFSKKFNLRPLIEVFKFLEPKEIVKLGSVCTRFYETVFHQEVWGELLQRDYPLFVPSEPTLCRSYFKLYLEHCLECKQPKQTMHRCPVSLRLLCLECRISSKYKPISSESMQKHYGVSQDWIESEVFKWIDSSEGRVTYSSVFQEKLIK